MANKTIIKVETQASNLVLWFGTGPLDKYTFPLANPLLTINSMSDADKKFLTDLLANSDARILDAISKMAVPTTAPTTTPPTQNTGLSVLTGATFTANSTVSVPEGVDYGVAHIPVPLTISGQGMRKSIFDASKVGRLAYGKAILHVGAGPALIEKSGFKYPGSGPSDAEAAVYFEGYDGTAIVRLCAFDGGENGIFMPGWYNDNGKITHLAPIDLLIDRCVFGRLQAIGEDDGKSHNLYVAGRSVTVKNSILLGSNSNTLKCRGPKLDVSDTFFTRKNNRWIDLPGMTVAKSTRNTYITPPGVDVQNAFGFYDESDDWAGSAMDQTPNPNGSFTSVDDTFYFSRWNEVIWINSPNFKVTFQNPKVFWIGSKGSTPPTVTIQGPGSITGVNPFVFNESNRVDSAPAIPADPV